MKLHVIVTAAALALGSTAFAADEHHGDTAHDKAARAENSAARAGHKMRDAMHRMGEKTRRAFHRGDRRIERSANRDYDANDTRAMGSSGTSDAERARRQRMDDAYDNWHRQQQR